MYYIKSEMQPNIKANGVHKVAGDSPLKQHQLGNSFHFFQYLKKLKEEIMEVDPVKYEHFGSNRNWP